MNFSVGNIKHIKRTENKLDIESRLRTRWAPFCVSPQSPPRKFTILTAIWKLCSPFTAVCEETSTVTPDFFPAFAKNNLIKNIFEKEKNFDNRTWLFLENSSALGVFWLRRGLQANHGTVRKSAKSPQPGNQKQVKWSNTVYFNQGSFNFKIKFCVFQVTKAKCCMKVIRIFNAQNTHFKVTPFFYCIFLMFISWMLIIPSFKKSLIVEQFQGNYLNVSQLWKPV